MFGMMKKEKKERDDVSLLRRLVFIGRMKDELDKNPELTEESRAQLQKILDEQAAIAHKDLRATAKTTLKVLAVGSVMLLIVGGAVYFMTDTDETENEQSDNESDDNSDSDTGENSQINEE